MVLRGNETNFKDLEEPLTRLQKLAEQHDGEGIKKILKEMIPEYTPRKTGAVIN
jgi:hypothetical protein